MRENFSLYLQAVEKREALIESGMSCRIFDGRGDGMPGLIIDKFDAVLLAHLVVGDSSATAETLAQELRVCGEKLCGAARTKTIYLRLHHTDPKHSAGKAALHITGPKCVHLSVIENGAKFIVRPRDQVNAGLFLDMRDVRQRVCGVSSGKRVLNTFCFTGSLGVAALLGRAKEVVQVDISKAALAWAKENLSLNKEGCKGEMRFICEDTLAFMVRELRRKARGEDGYDLIILDPPAFGDSKQKNFSFERDSPTLVELGLRLLNTGGEIIFSTNLRSVTPQLLTRTVQDCSHTVGVQVEEISQILPPGEFSAPIYDSTVMRGVWVRVR